MNTLVKQLDQLLPQTQCRECGFDGCLPYAQALATGEAAVNLCAPGGEMVMLDIAQLLQRPAIAPAKIQTKALAWIDENICIGCTACIRVCPSDAIMGASKYMHTVIADECTGCGLCVPSCPVDCIYLHDVQDDFLPRNRYLAAKENSSRFAASNHARLRYEWHQERKARDLAEKKAQIAEREAATKARLNSENASANSPSSAAKPAFNPADLIAKAMAKASAQQEQRTVPNNRASFQAQQIKDAQEKALFRRYQRDAQYGDEAEKNAAIAWLRAYKAEQEAKLAAKSVS
ncbi:MAG: RnfABCDGE type electron transport complex subunit B [Neisseria sp.]|nr:RnfABCDGE type electron transport complex subunit B [Neisseria sp.]